eukprot:1183201-Prorocentrum_minimum.AAC.1
MSPKAVAIRALLLMLMLIETRIVETLPTLLTCTFKYQDSLADASAVLRYPSEAGRCRSLTPIQHARRGISGDFRGFHIGSPRDSLAYYLGRP